MDDKDPNEKEPTENELWREHKAEMDKMRNNRRWQFRQTIKEFRDLGFDVKEISPFQYRINECLDIFPSNKRYHDLKKNVRGDIRKVGFNQFIRQFFGLR